MDSLYWRVDAPSGATTLEPPEHASIRFAPTNSVRLVVAKANGTPVVRVELHDGGKAFRPIFYRKRSQALHEKSSRVDAVVFGKGREVGSVVETTLWAAINGRIVDCPQSLIDQTMIDLQVRGLH